EDTGEKYMQLAAALTGMQDIVKLKVLDKTIFDHEKWEVDPNNELIFDKNLQVNNLRFSKGQQFLSANTSKKGKNENLDLEFGKFELQNFLGIITAEEPS